MRKPRIVLDTNLLVSAALRRRSVPRQAFELAFRRGDVLVSSETLAELEEVLTRSKFDRYLSREKRVLFWANFLNLAKLVAITESVSICRDPKDDKFLSLAVSGGADFLVSGDADLLVLHPFRGIGILTPVDFLDTLTKHSD